MTNDDINWAIEQPGSTAEKFVLMLLSNRANEQGLAWPSVATIGRWANLKSRQVQYIQRALEKMGQTSMRTSEGPRGVNMYQVHSHPCTPMHPRCNPVHPTPAVECTTPLHSSAPNPSVHPTVLNTNPLPLNGANGVVQGMLPARRRFAPRVDVEKKEELQKLKAE